MPHMPSCQKLHLNMLAPRAFPVAVKTVVTACKLAVEAEDVERHGRQREASESIVLYIYVL